MPGVDERSELLPSLLTLSDVYLTGYHAARMGRFEPGATVTVIGDGAVGYQHRFGVPEVSPEVLHPGRVKSRRPVSRCVEGPMQSCERGSRTRFSDSP